MVFSSFYYLSFIPYRARMSKLEASGYINVARVLIDIDEYVLKEL